MNRRRLVTDRYINPLTDFGFKHPPEPLQESTFMQLSEIAEIANFSLAEQGAYEDSLKYYRDLNNVVDTSRQEGREEEATRIAIRLIRKRFNQISDSCLSVTQSLSVEESEALIDAQMDFDSLNDLEVWLETCSQLLE